MTFIPDLQQKPRKYRRTWDPYKIAAQEAPRYAVPEARNFDHEEVIDELQYIAYLLARPYTDQTYAISNTASTLFLDYKGRKHLYLFSPIALTLNLNELGTLAVAANSWTDISFKEGIQLFTTNQANLVLVFVRATDDLIVSPTATQAVAGVTGGSLPFHAISLASTNSTNVKAAAGLVYGITLSNTNASARFFKLYDKATAPTVGTDTPKTTIQIPGNGTVLRAFPVGLTFSNGIGFGATGAVTDADTTAIGANDLSIDLDYK